MSGKLGNVIGGVVGAVAGYFLGGPMGAVQGFSIGYSLGGYFDPKTKVLGPKLADLKAPSASYGTPIAYVEGAPRLAGCFVWSSAKREISTTQSQGKGGPGVDATTFTYKIDCGIMLSCNECDALRRVWSNGKLVWTVGDDSDGESVVASNNTTSWDAIRFYSGAAVQLPDPTYEALVGVGNAPAYRGRSVVVIEGLNLGNSGQVPVLTFEVVSTAQTVYGSAVLDGAASGPAPFNIGTPAFTLNGYIVASGQWTNTYLNSTLVWYALQGNGAPAAQENAYSIGYFCNPIVGNSDIDCYVSELVNGGTKYACYTPANNLPVVFDLGENIGQGNSACFSRRDGLMAFGIGSGAHALTIRVFSSSDGAPIGSTPSLGTYLSSLAIGNGNIYAVDLAGANLYVFDSTTLALSDTITTPMSGGTERVVVSDEGAAFLFTSTAIYQLVGAAWETITTSAGKIGTNTYSSHGVVGGIFYTLAGNGAGDHEVWESANRVGIDAPALSDVVSRLCLRTGQLSSGDIDVSALSGQVVRAMAISQVGPTRTTLETLMAAYLFEFSEGQTLRAVPRGGAVALTIPYSDLGVNADGTAEPLPIKRVSDPEQAAQITIKYANVANDFQDGAETADRLVTESTAVSVVDVPLGFLPSEAKRLAEANTMDLAVGLVQIGPISLSRKYSALEATDVISITAIDGSTFRSRIGKNTVGGGIVTLELALDDATAIDSVVNTDETYSSSTLVRALAPTAVEYLDIPILRDADNDAGFYVDAKPNGDRWPGAALFSSRDDVTYAKEVTITDVGIFGPCATTLGDWAGRRVFDEVNAVTVNAGAALASATRDDLLNDQTINACAIGVDGRWELLQFRTATFVSAGVYTLTGLLRGSRGTEWAATGHAAGETFVLLQAAGMRRVEVESTLLGIERYYKAVTLGRNLALTKTDDFTDNGVGLRPFSPFDVRATRDATSGDIALTWKRRTRLAVRTIGPMGISIPLGEDVEAYSVDIFATGGYASVVRTLTASTPSAAYTSVQQTVDFGSNQATIYVKIYQLSGTVGRGTELKAAA